MKDIINVSVITPTYALYVAIIVLISWLPLHVAKIAIQKYDPSETDKIMDKINH